MSLRLSIQISIWSQSFLYLRIHSGVLLGRLDICPSDSDPTETRQWCRASKMAKYRWLMVALLAEALKGERDLERFAGFSGISTRGLHRPPCLCDVYICLFDVMWSITFTFAATQLCHMLKNILPSLRAELGERREPQSRATKKTWQHSTQNGRNPWRNTAQALVDTASRCEDESQVRYNWWYLIRNRPWGHKAKRVVPCHTLTLRMSNQWAFMGDFFWVRNPKSFRFGAASPVETWLRSHNAGGEWKLQICEDAWHLQNLFLQTCSELCALQERLSRTQNRVAQDGNIHSFCIFL